MDQSRLSMTSDCQTTEMLCWKRSPEFVLTGKKERLWTPEIIGSDLIEEDTLKILTADIKKEVKKTKQDR